MELGVWVFKPEEIGVDTVVVLAVVVPETRWMAAFLCGSVTTVMDRLFLPGSMYVSLTHTIPSRRLALTLDEVTDEEDVMDARIKINFQHDQIIITINVINNLPAIVAGTAVTVAPPGMTGRRL